MAYVFADYATRLWDFGKGDPRWLSETQVAFTYAALAVTVLSVLVSTPCDVPLEVTDWAVPPLSCTLKVKVVRPLAWTLPAGTKVSVLMLPTLIGYIFLQKQLTKGITAGAVKG